jgi:hypothetical protein
MLTPDLFQRLGQPRPAQPGTVQEIVQPEKEGPAHRLRPAGLPRVAAAE